MHSNFSPCMAIIEHQWHQYIKHCICTSGINKTLIRHGVVRMAVRGVGRPSCKINVNERSDKALQREDVRSRRASLLQWDPVVLILFLPHVDANKIQKEKISIEKPRKSAELERKGTSLLVISDEAHRSLICVV